MFMKVHSLFSDIPADVPEEMFEDLFDTGTVRIERIVSCGHSSPEGFWYDQDWNEWVMVIRGSAGLRLEGSDEVLVLNPGDWVNIPAHRKHRVEWTDPNGKTVWLAVHC